MTVTLQRPRKFLQLNDIDAYTRAFHLSNEVWSLVLRWDEFARNTIGRQFVRAVDSISANIAEGFGRYSKADKIKFYWYSYGSAKESLDWNEKAHRRGLVTEEQYRSILTALQEIPRELHALIKFTRQKLAL